MGQAEDMTAIANYMAGARGGLQAKLASGKITAAQARDGETIAMNFASWYGGLNWFDKNTSSDALANAKAKRQAFNYAVAPHDTAWVNATSADIPEEQKTFKIDPKGNVVHKATGKTVPKSATKFPPGMIPGGKASAAGAKAPVADEKPGEKAPEEKQKVVEAGMFGPMTKTQGAIAAAVAFVISGIALFVGRGQVRPGQKPAAAHK